MSNYPPTPSVSQINKAVQDGFFVFHGNRQKVLEAVSRRNGDIPRVGYIWVKLWNRQLPEAWHYVLATSVIITTERFGGIDMAQKGKREKGRPSHVGRKPRSSKGVKRTPRPKPGPTNQPDLEGVSIDERRIEAIETAYEAYQKQSEKSSKMIKTAHADLTEAEQRVVSVMHEHGYDTKKKPIYSRAGWGNVILQEKGEITETIKYVAAVKPKKKKKGDAAEQDNSDEQDE